LVRIKHRLCGKTLEFIRLEDGSLLPAEFVNMEFHSVIRAGNAVERRFLLAGDPCAMFPIEQRFDFDGADPLRRAGNGHQVGVVTHTTGAMQPGLDSAPPKSL